MFDCLWSKPIDDRSPAVDNLTNLYIKQTVWTFSNFSTYFLLLLLVHLPNFFSAFGLKLIKQILIGSSSQLLFF